MVKTELITKLAEETDISLPKADIIVSTIFLAMAEELAGGGRIEIRGFGSFSVKTYPGHTGRNPRTGEPVNIPGKKSPFFKAGKGMAEKIRGGTVGL